MAFGVLIDAPLLTVTFALLVVYRRRLAAALIGTGLPRLLLFLVVAAPLIVFEEQIDCMPSWCGKVIIPPTLYFLEVEMLVLGGLAIALHSRNALRVALAFSVYGVFFEYFLGGLRGLSPSLEAVVLVPYVAMGYVFVSLLPLEVLVGSGSSPKDPLGAVVRRSSQAFERIKVAMKSAVKVVVIGG